MNRQPDRRLVGIGPGDAMAAMGGQVDMITRQQPAWRCGTGDFDNRGAG